MHHDGSTLSIDSELNNAYTELFKTFSHYAQSTAVSDFERIRHHLIGLRAIHAMVESKATYCPDNRSEPSILLPAILSNMLPQSHNHNAPGRNFLEDSQDQQPIHGDTDVIENWLANIYRMDNISEVTITFPELDRWAYYTLHLLAKNSHSSHIRSITHTIFRFLDKSSLWKPWSWVILLFRCVLDALPPHQQNIVIFDILSFVFDYHPCCNHRPSI